MTSEIAHEWERIGDLDRSDAEHSNDELQALLAVWADERDALRDHRNIDVFNERLQREWAIETGIIERIYTLDRGVTRLLIEQGIDASLIPHDSTNHNPEFVAEIIRDQQAAVEWLFDVVAEARPLSTSFIRELHQLMTRKQETVEAVDQFGNRVEMPLNHGEYKERPNNPQRGDGSGEHQYCPPDHVAAEMDQLIALHLEHEAANIAPEVEAAWLHHRFTQIHPFQDGNGRIARALASLVTIRGGMFPLVITRNDRSRYRGTLEAADSGDLVPLIDFFVDVQKRQFVRALGISREVRQDTDRVEQVLDAIGDMFGTRDQQLQEAFDTAKETAIEALDLTITSFDDLQHRIQTSLGINPGRHTFVDHASPDDPRRRWHRFQVISTAKEHEYFANLGDFNCWARLGIITESGKSEILLSLHALGYEYRGLVAASLTFFRRQESDDGERIVVDLQAASPDVFIINYKERPEAVLARYRAWLERGIVRALEAWRRGE